MSSIDDLKSTFTAGFARSNRYRVFFPDGNEELNILCDSITWPGRQIFTNERFVDMKATKVAYGFGAEDIEVSFILGNDWYPWNYLNDWMNRVIGNIEELNSFTVNYKSDYARNNVRIQHLDTQNNTMKEVSLKNVYPTSLNTIDLSNESENEVIRVSAELSYDNWEIIS